MIRTQQAKSGFTIVELLIVIVVIGILAAITIVAYNGIQQRSRDSKRVSDIAAITKALELYYIDNSEYPLGSGSTSMSGTWSTTADASWQNLATKLKPYMASLPSDPISSPNIDMRTSSTGNNYAYYGNAASFCGASQKQLYLLIYRLEGPNQEDRFVGSCSVAPSLSYSGVSNYRVNK
ncbi:MAG: prepilin-type N-terminal cleavage/methylation domain-containing protein [Candidatus Saccharimonadales bacterium]